jgi:hypothetical protein
MEGTKFPAFVVSLASIQPIDRVNGVFGFFIAASYVV